MELCEKFGADYRRTGARIKLGWSIEQALFHPKIIGNPKSRQPQGTSNMPGLP
jgi:hypothetical protein